MSDDRRVLATNRKARHVYHILEKETAGIELLGTEVKAIRDGRINLKEAYVSFAGGEAFLVGCHVGAYEAAGYAHHDPVRRRRLLLNTTDIDRLTSPVQASSSLDPSRWYNRGVNLKPAATARDARGPLLPNLGTSAGGRVFFNSSAGPVKS
jgi:SsrA-binding protein